MPFITYGVGILMVLYAIVYRGSGANDWSGATIMMFIAGMGILLQWSISCQGAKK
ncbi:MAG: hypothetical protein AAB473_05420 [Patescibacteria group bacterium]